MASIYDRPQYQSAGAGHQDPEVIRQGRWTGLLRQLRKAPDPGSREDLMGRMQAFGELSKTSEYQQLQEGTKSIIHNRFARDVDWGIGRGFLDPSIRDKGPTWKRVAPVIGMLAAPVLGVTGAFGGGATAGATAGAPSYSQAAFAADMAATGFAPGTFSSAAGITGASLGSQGGYGGGVAPSAGAASGKAAAALGLSTTEKVLLASSVASLAMPTPDLPSPAPLGEAPEFTNRTQDFETRKQQMDRMASAAGVTLPGSDVGLLGPRRGAKARGIARQSLIGY